MNRKLFYGLNFLLVVSFLWSVVVDYSAEWRDFQKLYWQRQAQYLEKEAAETDDAGKQEDFGKRAKAARREPMVIRQIIAKDLGRVDRCITCHVGMDEFANPSLATPFKEHPFAGHPDISVLAKKHPFQKYGCTVCHEGQGLATTKEAAHGRVKHWEKPMLPGRLIQASCAKCHMDVHATKGAENVALGKDLFQ
ncbi:MAG: hypothetical protein HY553_20275, partial [Elusimicrobia bacterium]|nr:hypothetical protein [Elusimicrobiota bacterium]